MVPYSTWIEQLDQSESEGKENTLFALRSFLSEEWFNESLPSKRHPPPDRSLDPKYPTDSIALIHSTVDFLRERAWIK